MLWLNKMQYACSFPSYSAEEKEGYWHWRRDSIETVERTDTWRFRHLIFALSSSCLSFSFPSFLPSSLALSSSSFSLISLFLLPFFLLEFLWEIIWSCQLSLSVAWHGEFLSLFSGWGAAALWHPGVFRPVAGPGSRGQEEIRSQWWVSCTLCLLFSAYYVK